MNPELASSDPHTRRWRSVVLLLWALFATTAALWFSAQYVIQSIRISFAAEQVQVFEWSLENALKGEPSEAVAQLQYVRGYYPSGTKQISGSFPDRMVETHRASVIREIITYLRLKTGADLGADPQSWIDRYGAR